MSLCFNTIIAKIISLSILFLVRMKELRYESTQNKAMVNTQNPLLGKNTKKYNDNTIHRETLV